MSSIIQEKPATATLWLQPDRYALLAVYVLAVVVILIPLAVIDIPIIADYPNHVARMHILGNVNTETLLGERYISDFDFIPNLAMDLTIPWLAKIMPLDVAGRLFLAFTLLSTLGSIAFLHRTLFNQWTIWPLAATLVLYHGSFMAGMVNFSLGIGLVPAALAVWITMRYASMARRVMVGSAMALVLFFCHVVAFGAYGLLVIGYEGLRARDKWSRRDGPGQAARDFLIAGITGLVPATLLLRQLLQRDPGASAESTLAWGTWSWKAKALLSPLANYNLTLDLATFALLAILVIWGWRSGRLEIERHMAPGLGLLALCFILAPKALGTGGVLDQRFSIVFALVFIGSTSFRTGSSVVRIGLTALLAALFLVRLGLITSTWIDHRDDLAEMRSAIGEVETGARILVVQPDETAGIRLAPDRHIVFHHAAQMASLATLAVIEKSAFVSTIYAVPGQQPLRLQEPFQHLGGQGAVMIPTLADLAAALDRHDGDISAQIRSWWRDFDYILLIYGYGPGAESFRGDLPLKTLMDGDILDLFEIDTR